jgi:hypothetical protein
MNEPQDDWELTFYLFAMFMFCIPTAQGICALFLIASR